MVRAGATTCLRESDVGPPEFRKLTARPADT